MADIKNHSTLTTSLVSYWDLEEASGTRYDLHGSNDLTDGNTVGYTTGKLGNAADFVSTNSEYLQASDIGGTATFSIALWYNPDSVTANQAIFHKCTEDVNGDTTGAEYRLLMLSSGNLQYSVGNGSVWVGGSVASGMSNGTWYHLVLLYDGTTIKLYKNGSLLDSTTSTFTPNNTNTNLYFGKRVRNTTDLYLDAQLDEIGFWTKALSTDEISDLYNSGNGLPYYDPADIKNDTTLSTSLEGYWEMEEASGTRVDSTANGRDLSESGGTPGRVTGVLSGSDYALDVDGVNEYVRTANNWTHYGASAISFNVWMKTSTTNGTDMVMNVNDGTVATFQIIRISGSGYRTEVVAGGTARHTGSVGYVTGAETEDGAWHMLTGTYDGSNVKIFLDGVLKYSYAATGTINTSNPTKLAFGARSTGADLFLDASLDEAGAWSKALSMAEIRALYGYGTPPVYEAAAPAATSITPTPTLGLLGVG